MIKGSIKVYSIVNGVVIGNYYASECPPIHYTRKAAR